MQTGILTTTPARVADLAESLLHQAQALFDATRDSTAGAYGGGAYSPAFVAVLANGATRAALDCAILAATVDGSLSK